MTYIDPRELVPLCVGVGEKKAAVYKHIPDYFPNDVGVVGGIVGVLGGLGGFVSPVIFGYLLDWTGLWITTWVFFAILSAVCLVWKIGEPEFRSMSGANNMKNK